MGANAQTSVPTFTAGEILTAANMNISAATGIPVFADSTARDAAFGSTGEKTLAEGQFAYLEDSNTTQYYDGSNWQSVATSPGLVLIQAQTAFSAASSVTLDTAFSSTYTNYQILLNYTTSTTNNVGLRFRVSGSSVSTTTYNSQGFFANDTALVGARSTGLTNLDIGVNSQGTFNCASNITIFNPNVATPTTMFAAVNYNSGAYTGQRLANYAGNQTDSTQFTGFEIFVATGTMTGNYALYGYAK
jgi:hypothetical protein